MEYQEIICEHRNQIAWVYLNRPKDMNALTQTMFNELGACFSKAAADDSVRVVVLSGKGQAFCAGADLKGLIEDLNKSSGPEQHFFDAVESTFEILERFPKPVIAALNGIAAAGGLELAMTADLIIAAENAKLGDAHANFGVLPGAGGAVKLPRKIGINRAKYLLFSGNFISATEMKDFGLVNKVVPYDQLETEVQILADNLSQKSPLVLRLMKKLVREGLEQPLETALHQELLVLKAHTRSYDMSEGLKAFAEKRKPEFKGY